MSITRTVTATSKEHAWSIAKAILPCGVSKSAALSEDQFTCYIPTRERYANDTMVTEYTDCLEVCTDRGVFYINILPQKEPEHAPAPQFSFMELHTLLSGLFLARNYEINQLQENRLDDEKVIKSTRRLSEIMELITKTRELITEECPPATIERFS